MNWISCFQDRSLSQALAMSWHSYYSWHSDYLHTLWSCIRKGGTSCHARPWYLIFVEAEKLVNFQLRKLGSLHQLSWLGVKWNTCPISQHRPSRHNLACLTFLDTWHVQSFLIWVMFNLSWYMVMKSEMWYTILLCSIMNSISTFF